MSLTGKVLKSSLAPSIPGNPTSVEVVILLYICVCEAVCLWADGWVGMWAWARACVQLFERMWPL